MKFTKATILCVCIAIFCNTLSFSQNNPIYTIDLKTADIPSADFKEQKPEFFIQQARSLAGEKPDSALFLASKALLVAKKLQLPQWEAQSFRRIGLLLLGQEEYLSSLHYLHRSEEYFEEQKSTKDLRIIYNNLGVAYDYLGENSKAISYYFKSLEQAEIEGNTEKQIIALSNLGDLSIAINQYKSAKDYLVKGLKLCEEEDLLWARMQNQLGTSLIELGNIAEAEKNLQLAKDHYEALGEELEADERVDLADIYNDFGRIAKEKQDFTLAKKYYDDATRIYQETASPKLVVGWMNLGNLSLAKKENEKAIFYFQKALNYSEAEIDPLLEKNLYLDLSIAYGNLGQSDLAQKYQYSYAYLTDSIYKAEIQETTSRAELLYTQARSERKTEEVNRELARQKTFSNYLLGALFIAGLLALIFYLFMRNYAQRKEALRLELQHKEESNKLMVIEMLKDHEVENLNAMLDGQENERKRIARDLHDSMGGTLAAIQLTLASLRRKLPKMSEVAQKNYDKAESLLDKAYEQMRGISHNLVDLSLKDGGLSPALKQLNETLSENTHIDIQMKYESLGGRRLDSNVEQHSYRITQELFQNIIKHAEASQIEYELNYSPSKLEISIEDDGKGFSYSPGNKVPGIGLNNILTRVRQLEGEMDIQTKPGEGTRIKVDIPLVLS